MSCESKEPGACCTDTIKRYSRLFSTKEEHDRIKKMFYTPTPMTALERAGNELAIASQNYRFPKHRLGMGELRSLWIARQEKAEAYGKLLEEQKRRNNE